MSAIITLNKTHFALYSLRVPARSYQGIYKTFPEDQDFILLLTILFYSSNFKLIFKERT